MPRLIVRKSALSTTHYCRRWIPGNSAKTQRRKPSDECYYYNNNSSSSIPSGTGGRQPTETTGKGQGGRVVVGVAEEGAGSGLIVPGVRVVLNIFRWFWRSRCALVIFLALFFTLSFFKLTFDNYDSDLDTPYPEIETVPDWRAGVVDHAPPTALTLNAANYRLSRPNCSALEAGDDREIRLIEDMLYKETRAGIPNSYFQASTTNCSNFRSLRNYADMAYSTYELQTPLAYVIAVKSSAEQVERLLRAVYAPQNIYCLYSLIPTINGFKTNDLGFAIHRIAGCFGNVFVTSHFHEEGSKNAPEAPYRVCLEALLAYPSWRYVLLTSEGDFPLKTNREIVNSVHHGVAAWRLKRTKGQSPVLPPLNNDNDFSGFVITRKMAQLAVRRLSNNPSDKTNAYTMRRAWPGPLPDFSDLKIRFDNFCPDGNECALTSSDMHWLLKQRFLFARRFDLQTDYVVISCLETRLKMLNVENQEIQPVE